LMGGMWYGAVDYREKGGRRSLFGKQTERPKDRLVLV